MDEGEEPQPDAGDAEYPRPAQGKPASFGPLVPAGFAQSLLPRYTSLTANINESLISVDLGLNFQSLTNTATKQIQGQLGDTIRAQYQSMFARLVDSERILKSLRRAVAPYKKTFAELPRLLLPPNLRAVSDDITAVDVLEFLEKEGIPLYLIPRAAIGKRFVLAKDHARRRKVLNDRFVDLVEDCVTLLHTCSDPITSTEVHFVRDGIGALKAGHHAAAQAIFTVTLDTLISRFYPDSTERKQITNRKKGDPMPDKISDMGVRDAYIWLPVWNAHQQYWQHKGDRIPNDYSRHATVHAVSKTQFNKRNCIQSLMLTTSLIGYADQLVRAASGSMNDD